MGALLYLLGFSLLINALLLTRILMPVFNQQDIGKTVPQNTLKLTILAKEQAELYTDEENTKRSDRALETAATFMGERGEGKLGWLWLLAAVDLNRRNLNALYNLVTNYNQLYDKFSALSYSEIVASKLSASEKSVLMDTPSLEMYQSEFSDMSEKIAGDTAHLPDPCTTYAFTTAFSVWDLLNKSNSSSSGSGILSSALNDAVYKHSVETYEALKAAKPHLSATDLNHELFRLQMSKLELSSSYWGDFQKIPGFQDLVLSMRRAAKVFLVNHGWDEDSALRKASHPLVVWVSVHTTESVHQPHVTEDALVGGVYYVRAPPGSGRLEMYDPRGKHPVHGLSTPTSPPEPPFHRTVALQPREGRLVLFPGWLVHSVLPSPELAPPTPEGDGYRVSLSLNLKGEWQDTASLHLKHCSE